HESYETEKPRNQKHEYKHECFEAIGVSVVTIYKIVMASELDSQKLRIMHKLVSFQERNGILFKNVCEIYSCDNNCKLPDELYPRCRTLKTLIMFSVYAEKRNLIESTKEFNWKNRRIVQMKITEVVLSLRILAIAHGITNPICPFVNLQGSRCRVASS
ncbi:hypothetical protein L9F63_015324, partial [Diploptera punctata]